MFCHSDLWFIHKKARRTVKLAGPLLYIVKYEVGRDSQAIT